MPSRAAICSIGRIGELRGRFQCRVGGTRSVGHHNYSHLSSTSRERNVRRDLVNRHISKELVACLRIVTHPIRRVVRLSPNVFGQCGRVGVVGDRLDSNIFRLSEITRHRRKIFRKPISDNSLMRAISSNAIVRSPPSICTTTCCGKLT